MHPSFLPVTPSYGCQQQNPPLVLISLLASRNYRELRLSVLESFILTLCLEWEFRYQYPTSLDEPHCRASEGKCLCSVQAGVS